MSFCTNCGKELTENAKFCANCGSAINPAPTIHTTPPSESPRKEAFDGAIYKCPACGNTWNSFSTACPNCGYELRDGKNSNAIMQFVENLERAQTEKQKINLIKTFPIPNTKEDILEFLIIASSSFDARFYARHLDSDDEHDAWLTKIEQTYQKAKFSFKNDPVFEDIQEQYDEIRKVIQAEKKKANGFFPSFGRFIRNHKGLMIPVFIVTGVILFYLLLFLLIAP